PDSVVCESLEKFSCASAPDLDLGERGEIEDRRGLSARRVLDADGRRPEVAGPPARTQRQVAAGSIWLEPVGPLPSRLLAECSAELGQPGVDRREPQRPAGASLVAWVLDVVIGR